MAMLASPKSGGRAAPALKRSTSAPMLLSRGFSDKDLSPTGTRRAWSDSASAATYGTAKYISPKVAPPMWATKRGVNVNIDLPMSGDGQGRWALKRSYSDSRLSSRCTTPGGDSEGGSISPKMSSPKKSSPKSRGRGVSNSKRLDRAIPAGVEQMVLNPSIPFSGFPSLCYLRGAA
eukprot:TRINITY_DN33354_c0_g1_i1.p2 TRINITY_DN33354_c0_g1~~TRINITY_DN33354_c0_g1_i1.p2  ORF type:complete len:205 (+),score=22.31 TRINITY_DN33354_c0_g1_i1:90-617(+)